LHPAQASLHLADLGNGPRGIEARRLDGIGILPLADGEDAPILALQCRFDSPERPGATGPDRGSHSGEQDHLPQRQYGQSEPGEINARIGIAQPRGPERHVCGARP